MEGKGDHNGVETRLRQTTMKWSRLATDDLQGLAREILQGDLGSAKEERKRREETSAKVVITGQGTSDK